MLWIILALIISYLTGSIPTAYIFGRVIKRVDIRKFGSGNVGATNALRLLGTGWGVTVLILDIAKGILPVIFLPGIFNSKTAVNPDIFCILVGISCICGHNWTVFLKFKGGKGVATTLGVLIGLSAQIPGLKIILGLTVLIWMVTFVLSRIISLSSIIAAASFPLLALLFQQSYPVFFSTLLLSVFIILRHKPNIIRLLEGKESRISFKKK
jgi:glycerol-3-phosphate acyltransferase PlsY